MSAPRIVLGVGGGIAAYKAAELVRALVKHGAEVQVILTPRAEAFVTPLTLATLSGHPVWRHEFPQDPTPNIGHIELARWADALVVAPATANLIARLAHGLADDLVTTVALTHTGPIVLAPAMNPRMWDHAETRANVAHLASRGVQFVAPEGGFLACGDEGTGRLAALDVIARAALEAGTHATDFRGVRVLVTAGPTYEPIDPARFIGNRSSGKMGYAIAAAARARGAQVTLVTGPTAIAPPWGVTVVPVETADQMRAAVFLHAGESDVIVMSAAVADHKPAAPSVQKISTKDAYTLALSPNPDILAEVCAMRRTRQVVVGFAAETQDAVARGEAKRARKGCDLMVINDVTAAGAGFGTDTNLVTIVGAAGSPETWPLMAKRQVAERLLDRVLEVRQVKA